MKSPKVAIVHDWLYGGGAELVVEQLHKLYPEAPIYTSYCTDEWRQRLDNKVITGYLQNWPFARLRKFLPVLRQHWFKRLNLSGFDLVISSSGNGEAKFALPRPTTNHQRPTHVCYCHTPTHFYWRKYEEYLKNPSFRPKWLVRLGLRLLVKPLRKRDYAAAQNVDYFIANSSHIQKDIKKFYGRDSIVIHPPIDTNVFKPRPTTNPQSPTNPPRFITWGRHVPYKRFDLIIKACNQLQLPLTVVGKGPATAALKKLAGPTINFTGFISDTELATLTAAADGFIFAADEDFGISPVEAMAAGLPVIAYQSGGALDYVIEGKTGLFFNEQTTASLVAALQRFSKTSFQPARLQKQATSFSSERFRARLQSFITDVQ